MKFPCTCWRLNTDLNVIKTIITGHYYEYATSERGAALLRDSGNRMREPSDLYPTAWAAILAAERKLNASEKRLQISAARIARQRALMDRLKLQHA